jgi:hypothetical protein
MEEHDFLERLQGALTPDIRILKVYPPQTKFTELASCTYTVELEEPIQEEFLHELLSDSIVVSKHGKKGEVSVDIRPMILSAEPSGNLLKLHLTAGQTDFLNPDYVMKAIMEKSGGKYSFYRVTRTGCFRADGKIFL